MRSFKIFFILLLIFPTAAHAYIDPGSGSFLTQMLVAGFFGAVFSLRRFLSRFLPQRRKEEKAEHDL